MQVCFITNNDNLQKRMKFKEVKKIIAVAMAVSTFTPSAVYAAEPILPSEVQETIVGHTEITNEIPHSENDVAENAQENTESIPESTPEHVPDAETPEVPEVEGPEEPNGTPETPEIPEVPEVPETPEVPEIPEVSETPEVSEPEIPITPPATNPDITEEIIPEENSSTDEIEEIPETPSSENTTIENATMESTSSVLPTTPSFIGFYKKPHRFYTVARRYAFAKVDTVIKEEMKEDSRTVATLADEGICFLLKEEGDWYFVESGTVRGFLPKSAVVTGAQANHFIKEYRKMPGYTDNIESVAPVAQELIPSDENEAYFYTMGTTKQTIVDKVYALSTASVLNVREGKGTDNRIIGELPQNTLCYILADINEDWVYIEADDVRGFASKKYLRIGEDVNQEVLEQGEETYSKAIPKVNPEENKAFYYTHTSIKTDASTSKLREEIVDYASQFIGNPYVWGGTDPVKGADCSGFVQTIYRTYGVELPRVAADQAYAGEQIPVSEAQPGDLIFYKNNSGYIHHVVMYAGDGKTVEAKGRAYGIVSDDVSTTACWAVRLLDDETEEIASSSDIHEVNATEDMYGESLGEFHITYYCACEKCCDVETGLTATGTQVAEGRTIAVDPSVIPYGTQVIIGGHVFTAEDCGGAIKKNRIDIYVNSHERAWELGRTKAEVFLLR